MDFNLEHIIYLNLYSKPDSFHQFEKIAEFFHFNFSSIQKALDLNYSYVYIDVRNSEIIGELRVVAIKNDFFELAIPLQKIIKNVDSVKSSRYKTIVDSNFIFNKL